MGGNSKAMKSDQKPIFSGDTKCSYCGERPTLPYHMGCNHVFCYYCLQGNLIADAQFECPTCQKQSSFSKPL